jgi:ABC-2 type transport system permease protein
MVDEDFQPLQSSGKAEIFINIINDALIEKEPFGEILVDPTARVNAHALSPSYGLDDDDPLAFAVPMGTLFIFFFVITTSSGFMLTSVTKEKENRTAETLLVRIKPSQLMLGKIIGLGVIALLQMGIWLGGSITSLQNSSQLFAISTNFELPPGFIIWAVVFFIFGYFLYASILGTIGVLSPNAREGSQYTFAAIIPLLVPLWFNYTFTESPDGPVSIFLSIFPLTAPASMITRLTVGNVPTWQIAISLIGLMVTTYLFIKLASRFFRADTLLSNQSFGLKRIIREFKK